jgi:hypothetical protein
MDGEKSGCKLRLSPHGILREGDDARSLTGSELTGCGVGGRACPSKLSEVDDAHSQGRVETRNRVSRSREHQVVLSRKPSVVCQI